MGLVAPLFEGPIDIIGDIHGEFGALVSLLDRLGYDGNGLHPQGRRLVFVGDLVDRGPDSLGVLRLVRGLIEKGKAQMVLGNHELNLVRGQRKHGGLWWYGETETIVQSGDAISFQTLLTDPEERMSHTSFLAAQPICLQSADMVVIHAQLTDSLIETLAGYDGGALEAYRHFSTLAEMQIDRDGVTDADTSALLRKSLHPLKVALTGKEARTETPFFAGGKWRTFDRERWWESRETSHPRVVFGHYWRRLAVDPSLSPEDAAFAPAGPDPFPSLAPHVGINGTLCIDYSVGVRYEERARNLREGALGTDLAAYRWPEDELVFASGLRQRVDWKHTASQTESRAAPA